MSVRCARSRRYLDCFSRLRVESLESRRLLSLSVPSSLGLYEPTQAHYFLKQGPQGGIADEIVQFGPGSPGWQPLAGDWTGDGVDSLGLFDPVQSTFYLKNDLGSGAADTVVPFGAGGRGWIPLAGDWNGDGRTTVGLFDPLDSIFYLRNTNDAGPAEHVVQFGPSGAGWSPIVGDWDGDGAETVGLYNGSQFFLKNSLGSGPADQTFQFGPKGAHWIPIVGDWNGDGVDTVGLFEPTASVFFFRNAHEPGPGDGMVGYGPAGAAWTPLIGSWDFSSGTTATANETSVPSQFSFQGTASAGNQRAVPLGSRLDATLGSATPLKIASEPGNGSRRDDPQPHVVSPPDGTVYLIEAAPFERLAPLGSLVFASRGNASSLLGPGDVGSLQFFVQQGQTIGAVATPTNPNATLSFPNFGISAPAPGQPVVLDPAMSGSMANDGYVSLQVVADSATDYTVDVYLNASLEAFVGDSDSGNAPLINPSFVELGATGRFAVVGTSTPEFSQTVLYGAATGASGVGSGAGPSSLYRIDPNTGDATLVGPIGFDGVTGLTFLDDGRLVGTANGDALFGMTTAILIEIDPRSGAGTLIGIVDQSPAGSAGRMPDLGYDHQNNVLYAYSDFGVDGLYIIDPLTGAGTLVGPTGFFGGGNGLDVDPFSGVIYATPFDEQSLVTIDPITGLGTSIPGSVGNVPYRINALDFHPTTGALYGSLDEPDSGSYLVTISKFDGIATVIGPTVPGLDALAWSPGGDELPTSTALVGVDFDSSFGVAPLNWTRFTGNNPEALLVDLVDENGARTSIDLEIISSGLFSDFGSPPSDQIPNHANPLHEVSGNLYTFGATTLVWRDLEPGKSYAIWLFGLDTIDTHSAIAIETGSAFGGSLVEFEQTFLGNQMFVNAALGSSDLDLASFAQVVTANASGEIAIHVNRLAGDGGIGGVAIKPMPGLLDESNDTISQAIETGIGPTTGGFYNTGYIGDNPSLPADVDVDLFRVDLLEGNRITIDVNASQYGSPLDPVLRLFNANGVQLAASDDSPAPGEPYTLDSYIDFTATERGAFYIGVSSYSNFDYDPFVAGSGQGGSTGPYDIRVQIFGAEDDFGDTLDAAHHVPVGPSQLSASISGTIGDDPLLGGLDVDMFAVILFDGDRLELNLDAEILDSPLDAVLRVFDSNGNQLAYSDVGPAPGEPFSVDPYIDFVAPANGTYYVGVSGYSNATYDPTESGSGTHGTVGAYTLHYDLTPAMDPGSAFNIEVIFPDSSLTASQQNVFATAAARWQEIIVGNLPSQLTSRGLIDDVAIVATAPAIDGPGGILGQAGPTELRSGSFLPSLGIMQFDSADLVSLEASGQLLDVILHEMGHVLGVGTIWNFKGLLVGGGGSDPRFTGAQATLEYNAIFNDSQVSVPVENSGGPGTRDSHWRESVFDNELMTGWLNSGVPNPLSRVTAASLGDLGYEVNVDAADFYTPPGPATLAAGVSVVGRLVALPIEPRIAPAQAEAPTQAKPTTDASWLEPGISSGSKAAPRGSSQPASTSALAGTELLINGGFEAGDFTGWVALSNGTDELTPWTVSTAGGGFWFNTAPLGGQFNAYNGFDGAAGLEYELYQDVTLPEGQTLRLTTNHRMQYDGWDIASTADRVLTISVRDTSNNVLQTLYVEGFNLNGQPYVDLGWNTQTFDLTGYGGQTVRIHFHQFVPEYYTGPANIEFDNISLIVEGSFDADVDYYRLDLTGLAGQPIDVVLAGQSGVNFSSTLLELLDLDESTVLAVGSPSPLGVSAANYDLGILNFSVPADGVYTLRLTSQVSGDYVIVVTDRLLFESEINDDLNDPLRELNQSLQVLGYLGVGSSGVLAGPTPTSSPGARAAGSYRHSASQEVTREASPDAKLTPAIAAHPAVFTALLPEGMSRADLAAQLAARGAQAQQQRIAPPLGPALISLEEAEPNDTLATANPLPLGFGPGQETEVDVFGSLALATVPVPISSQEDDGSIPLANPTGLVSGQSIVAAGTIGDGPFGATSGDFDFYHVPGVSAGDVITVDVDASEIGTGLDPVVGIYDSSGILWAINDDYHGLDSYLTFTAPVSGDYYVVVKGYGGDFQEDPFDSSSGYGPGSTGNYFVTIGINASDLDYFELELNAGDVLGAALYWGDATISLRDSSGTELIGSNQDITFIHPPMSPLPGGGSASLSVVVPASGTYYMRLAGGSGSYHLGLRLFRPALEQEYEGTRQILFLDFDGATVDTSIFGSFGLATLSPLSGFLGGWGLTVADEDAVIDAIVGTVEYALSTHIRAAGNNGDYATSGIPGQFDIEILNSRDHADPFGLPHVSRVIVGGSIAELGISTLGIAQSIDVGNFDTAETGVVLLDLLSADASDPNSLNQFSLAPSVTIVDLIGKAVGNIVAHEAGHFFGNWHTNQSNDVPDIMDQGGNLSGLIGIGLDGIFGTADDVDVLFGVDTFVPNEGFTGFQDGLNTIAFGLSTGTRDASLVGPTVASITPPPGSISDQNLTSIQILFSETITFASAIAPANYQLIAAGPNGGFDGGLGDDLSIPFTVQFNGTNFVELILSAPYSPLPPGAYRLTINGSSSIEDVDGNPLNSTTGPGGGSDTVHDFEVMFLAEPGGDFYRIHLAAGDSIWIRTETPFDHPLGDPLNTLDPAVLVVGPAGYPVASETTGPDGRNVELLFTAPQTGTYSIQVLAESGAGEYLLLLEYAATTPATIVDRRIFYNNSFFDGNNPAINPGNAALPHDGDDDAIAPSPAELLVQGKNPAFGKQALLPGVPASFINYTSYNRGINGVMIDLQNLADPAALANIDAVLDHFDFRTDRGTNSDPASWSVANPPLAMDVRLLPDGITHRITFVWDDFSPATNTPNEAVGNGWLRIVTKANAVTGLAADDVHYWGNQVGEVSGYDDGSTAVNSADINTVTQNNTGFGFAGIENPHDPNRDNRVNSADINVIAQNNSGFTPLVLFTPPAAATGSAVLAVPLIPSAASEQGDFRAVSADFEAQRLAAAVAIVPQTQQVAPRSAIADSIDRVLAFNTVRSATRPHEAMHEAPTRIELQVAAASQHDEKDDDDGPSLADGIGGLNDDLIEALALDQVESLCSSLPQYE